MIKNTQIKAILVLLIAFAFSFNLLKAQQHPFGNEWINYNQKYFSFTVYENGVYRIPYSAINSALQSQGINVQNINPRNFQIFGRGEEVAIYVKDENTGLFTSNDYIEFYAEKNTAWLDTQMFDSPDHLLNHEYSLTTDTAVYFFTWNSNLNNKRISIESDVNFGSYNSVNYFIYHQKDYYTSYFLDGEAIYSSQYSTVFDPEYNKGEGYYDSPIYLGGSKTKNVSTANVYTSGPDAEISFDVLGASDYFLNNAASPNHHLEVQFLNTTFDTTYRGYRVISKKYSLPANSINSSQTAFTFSSIDDLGVGADRFAISNIQIKYPHTNDMENKSEIELIIPDATQNKAFYTFSNFNGGSSPVFYDLTNNKKIDVVEDNGDYKILVPNSGGEKKCFFSNSSNIQNISSLSAVSANAQFVDILANNPNGDYFIITSPDLITSNGNYKSATDYQNYRNSTGYNAVLINVEDLYQQYSYGIRKHPLSIRNFLRRAQQYYTHELKGLFLLGKAYKYIDIRKNKTYFDAMKVPTMGTPPSDILLSAGLLDSYYQPLLPTGRISATNLNHIDLYLDKVMQYESPSNSTTENWRKEILHFGGGNSDTEQTDIRNYLSSYKNTIEGTYFGANVSSFFKTTTDPIQLSLSDVIKQKINSGVGMMTFFGHASGIGFDISIDHPSAYDNYGKYPVMLANSCYSGDIFTTSSGSQGSSSEQFVLIRDKGVIAYMAQVTQGKMGRLHLYSSLLHENMASEFYNKNLGTIMKETIREMQSSYSLTKEICYEMMLHGDPAIVYSTGELPDYEINSSSVSFNPIVVSSEIDSFTVNIAIGNIAKAIDTTIFVEIQRIFPDGSEDQIKGVAIQTPFYKDTVRIKFELNKQKGLGINTFTVNVDVNDDVTELNENNNSGVYTLDIKSSDVIPVYPAKYSIIPNSNVKLICSTVDPFTKSNKYYFEIDTNINFNSAVKETTVISSSGGLVEWEPNTVLSDSSVYFWRVSLDSAVNGEFNWRYSSFQYINNTSGWSQAHFHQFIDNDFQLVKPDENTYKYEFANDVKELDVYNAIPPALSPADVEFLVNGIQYGYWPCFLNGLRFAVFDTIKALPNIVKYTGSPIGQYQNYHCRNRDYTSYDFPTETITINGNIITDSAWFRRAADFIAQIPDNTPVMLMTVGNSYAENLPEYLYKAIDSLGSNYIRNLQNNRPYILFGKKGDLNNANELLGATSTSVLHLRDSLITNWPEGQIKSPLFGPSKKWNVLNWKQHALNNIQTDSVRLQLLGVKFDGTVDTLISGLSPDTMQVNALNNIANATEYPYLSMRSIMKDDSMRTPAQMDHWILSGEISPEFAFAPKTAFEFYNDTIQEGDSLRLNIAYKNISSANGDSLLVKYWIKNSDNEGYLSLYKRLKPIQANSVVIDTIKLPTIDLKGNCVLFIEINPVNGSKLNEYDQLEISHLNNTSYLGFYVEGDKENPLLDVTFDGVHILDGDIVSAKPEIVISLKDENKFISLNDTSLFSVGLIKPEFTNVEYLSFANPEDNLIFEEAKMPENKARVIYRPEFDIDGTYTLQVSARDRSYNESGNDDYEISFEIINQSTITEVMNWPNPFTTKTHFVFTLTGSELPDDITIQIMTISGKLVREITMDELGPIRIGKNITDYAWDGTDQYGDRLANGVYLYRVITTKDGKEVELNQTKASQYFTKKFGKMYLMR